MQKLNFTFPNRVHPEAGLHIPLGEDRELHFSLTKENGSPKITVYGVGLTITSSRASFSCGPSREGSEEIPFIVGQNIFKNKFKIRFDDIDHLVFENDQILLQTTRTYFLGDIANDPQKQISFYAHKNLDGGDLVTKLPITETIRYHGKTIFPDTGKISFRKNDIYFNLKKDFLQADFHRERTCITAYPNRIEVQDDTVATKMVLTLDGLRINRAGQVININNNGVVEGIANMGLRIAGSDNMVKFNYDLATSDIDANFVLSPFSKSQPSPHVGARQLDY